MPYDPNIDGNPRDAWGVVYPDGGIMVTAATRTDAITAATEIWTGVGSHRKARWRHLRRRMGCRCVRVVTHTLSREAATRSALATARSVLSASISDRFLDADDARVALRRIEIVFP